MRLDRHRRPLAATAAVAAVLLLGACGTSFNAQTNQQYQVGVGSELRDTPVHVLGALLVVNEDGSATVSATLVNKTDGDQRLSSVTLTGPDGGSIELDSTDPDALVIAPNEARTLGAVDGASQRLKSKVYTASGVESVGQYYTLTLTFSDAGEIVVPLPSVVRNATYADVALPEGADPAANLVQPGEEAMKRAEESNHGSSGGH